MLDMYLHFVHERHKVWETRQRGVGQPWSTDHIITTRKFTNVFRILDHGTQFVVRELLEPDLPFHDILTRVFLYRYTNRPEPWEHFLRVTGSYPVAADLSGRLQTIWGTYSAAGHPIFGNAYKMFSGAENKGMTRLGWLLGMVKLHVTPMLANRVMLAPDMETRLEILKEVPRCANFMAMQILTDIGYHPAIQGDENEFIVAGPGAKRGAKLIVAGPGAKRGAKLIVEAMMIYYLQGMLEDIRLPEIDRPPSLMDVQNTLCEFGKYVRWSNEPIRQKPYTPAHSTSRPIYPLHWRQSDHEQLSLRY